MAIGAAYLATSLLQTGLGMYNGYKQMQEGKALVNKYATQIENYERQELTNAYKGMRVPQERMRLAEENIGASTSQALENASKLGIGGYSSVPQILRQERTAYDDVASAYEQQRLQLDELIARDNVRIQTETGRREEQDLLALGQGLTSAQQMQQSGQDALFGSAVGGLTNIGTGLMKSSDAKFAAEERQKDRDAWNSMYNPQ